ncbi:MAG: HD domain-containing phosphohydrolase [Candidatus Omnitrophota bacterium]|nr:HD domain-containing phosphohydrolase [Candidatus Omnitrophota bacterium]
MKQEFTDREYQQELFDKLKKSVSLKKEEECFGSCLKSAMWWLIEEPHPSAASIKKLVLNTCPFLKKPDFQKGASCVRMLEDMVEKAGLEKRMVRFECIEGLRGFIYPISQGDKLYGYIGACYTKKDVSDEIMDIFAAFTDTIVKEVQKELELSKLYETIRPRAIALSTVHTVHRLIGSTLDMNELLPRVARLSLQVIRANRCSIKLVDSTKKLLLPKATVDLRETKSKLKKVRIGRWSPGKAAKFGRPIRDKNHLATPLIDEDVIGVITLYDKIDGKPFTQFDQEIMSTLAEQAVIAIKNAHLYKEQEKLTFGMIKSLAAIVSTRKSGQYMPRASFLRITTLVGQKLHLSGYELKSIEYSILLHDAGQLIVPEEVLKKPAKLTEKQYNLVKEHPIIGAEILKPIKALKSIIPIILHHHENYDGTGYPKGLKKDQIPVGARIMAVVSAFEAMITKKPYRTPKSINAAAEEIRNSSGKQFDPKVVQAFLEVIKRKDISEMLAREKHGKR